MTDVSPIRVEPDPYEPYRLSQGFRVGDLLLISVRRRSTSTAGSSASATSTRRRSRYSEPRAGARGRWLEPRPRGEGDDLLTDMANFPKIVELRGKWFTPPYPADTIVEVTSLALPELEIEIEAIAVAG